MNIRLGPRRHNPWWKISRSRLGEPSVGGQEPSDAYTAITKAAGELNRIEISGRGTVVLHATPEDAAVLKVVPSGRWSLPQNESWRLDGSSDHPAATLVVAAGAKVRHPLILETDTDWGLRLVMEQGAEAEVWCVGGASPRCGGRRQLELKMEADARAAWWQLQVCPPEGCVLDFVDVVQGERSQLRLGTFSVGGHLNRVAMRIWQRGAEAHSEMLGVAVSCGNDAIEHVCSVTHDAPRGTSRQQFRSISGGTSQACFLGEISITPEGKRSEASQLSRGLLLDARARVHTEPRMRVETDDVKCRHGAAVSQLRPEELFYLTSRGIDPAAARRMLGMAFACELVASAPRPWHAHLNSVIENILQFEEC